MNQSSLTQVSIRYGLITAAMLVLYSLVLQVSGFGNDTTLGYISYLLLVLGIFLGHKGYKENGDGFMTYGQGLGIGVIIAAVAGVLLAIFTYIYLAFVDQSAIDLAIEETRIRLEEQGMDDDVIDQTMAISAGFLTPGWLSFFSFLGTIIGGFVFSLVISAFTKKNDPETEF